ncbi:hypothetical protein F5884DRAFT_317671 [Xylogone sp. PMI_703]|nr:hypothetical protein F5884DRAFT_317671 [Xylogone sp. PMI_703]
MSAKTIRVALAGLSSKPSGYGWVNNVHLPYLLSKSNISIVGVLSSSKRAAEAAIAQCSLPSSVRAYGSPEELSKDEEVDLVVVGVPAPLHRNIMLPCIATGKDIFVEWPIDVSADKSRELVEAARAKGIRTAVGMQGRFAKVIQRVAEIVRSGRIGKVLSSSVVGGLPTGGPGPVKTGLKYSLDKDSGATMLDVQLAHFLECATQVIGPLKSLNSLVRTMRPETDIVDAESGEILEKGVKISAPDQVMVQAELISGGVISIHMHGGPSSGGARWLILGEKGEIDIRAPVLIPWIATPFSWEVTVKDNEGVTKEDIKEDEPGQVAVNRLWDAYLRGDNDTWPDFDHALSIHRIIDAVRRSNDERRTVVL